LQWFQKARKINGDNLNDVRLEACRTFTIKKKEYLKDKINELGTNSKNKNIRDLCRRINAFGNGNRPRNNLVKDKKGDLLADCHSTSNRWKRNFCQLLNVKCKAVAVTSREGA
jgi:hypothetical protein